METLEEKIARVIGEEVAIAAYDSSWPEMYEKERIHLLSCLPRDLVRRIEHFGSTAVPGLAAKPIVDMLVEVTSLDETRQRIVPILEAQGYDYFWRATWGEDTPPFYVWFIKRDKDGRRTHHIHIVEAGFEHWDRLLFRDFLIEHPEIARKYVDLKMRLSVTYRGDRVSYTEAKTDFIREVTGIAKRHYEKTGNKQKTMKISVILAHPDQQSFNHAIARTAAAQLGRNGHEVFFHDLYAENFDPLLPGEEIPKDALLPEAVEVHCREISEAEGIVIVHPNWWGQPPAVLKGWIDRIIRPGVAYEFLEGDSGEGVPNGLLKARAAVVFNTSNTAPEREQSIFGDPLETIWRNCIFGLCGVDNFYRRMFGVIVTSTESQRQGWLDDVRTTIDRFFPGENSGEKTRLPLK
jgi:putative NADPH-quinone reductase/GrpB-like predicted nucleotidyltransferase (UPF0157 family)